MYELPCFLLWKYLCIRQCNGLHLWRQIWDKGEGNEKIICSFSSVRAYCVVPQQGKTLWQKLHPSYLWLMIWLLMCSWTCCNQSSASRACEKTTVGPLSDPDSPIYSSKTPQETLSEMESEIDVCKTFSWKRSCLEVQIFYYLVAILFFIISWKVLPHTCVRKALPAHDILLVTKFSLNFWPMFTHSQFILGLNHPGIVLQL